MKSRPNWTEAVDRTAGPRYQAVVGAVELALQSGSLRPGDRLPPQRDLAAWLSLNIGTISRAYSELQRSGLARGEVGRGTFLNHLRDPDGPSSLRGPVPRRAFVDLSHNFPSDAMRHPALALIGAEFRELVDIGSLLASQVDVGLDRHRRIAAQWLTRLGVDATAEDLLITCGGQHGLMLALMALTRPGDAMLAEELVGCFRQLCMALARKQPSRSEPASAFSCAPTAAIGWLPLTGHSGGFADPEDADPSRTLRRSASRWFKLGAND